MGNRDAMSLQTKANSLQSYQLILYERALHPELFQLKGRRVIRWGEYEVEGWIMAGAHMLRFEHKSLCVSELVTDQERNLPSTGVVTTFLCAGERDYEHAFRKHRVTYMATVQTETLAENLYAATYKELLAFAQDRNSLIHQWDDESGANMSILDIEKMNKEAHAQAYHLIAQGGLVLRTTALFEHA